jgi:hypothetical protein
VALSRKLANVSFALLRTNARFVPAMNETACVATQNLSADHASPDQGLIVSSPATSKSIVLRVTSAPTQR